MDIEDIVDQHERLANGTRADAEGTPGGVVVRARKNREGAVGYDIPGSQLVYLKTYGCSHNNSDSEYMAGLLVKEGYGITEDFSKADMYLINSCTVKNPSEEHFIHEMTKARRTGKPTVVSGCVPAGDPKNDAFRDVSIIGVQQIHRVAEVMKETAKGNSVQITSSGKRAGLPSLEHAKIRRNELIEIIPINAGCLNKCTYCKTKHARGDLMSYPIEEICKRVQQVVEEGVKEIRLTSEDSGAYGRDIGTNIVELLDRVVQLIPEGVMLRVGMTNPPYILEHVDDIARVLNHPRVYSFLHLPVQAGCNDVLQVMQREYTVEEFELVCDTLLKKVPGMLLATDIICGFPSESEESFQRTLRLCQKYRFPALYISQYYPRSGTPAAAMKQLRSQDKKDRSRRLTQVFESYSNHTHSIVGTLQRVWITEKAHDKKHLVGHTKCYVQVLIDPEEASLGTSVVVKIVSASKHSVVGTTKFTPSRVSWSLLLSILVVFVAIAAYFVQTGSHFK
ncbi:Threonylcarbamoyladenosine tRNA methylthiotransferase [Diplonema papillatum]|nr:Threonylcarbamoyladenosine tRNA methylthiotransferase [Diplonema papillatum]|eukprot:gene1248-1936_t